MAPMSKRMIFVIVSVLGTRCLGGQSLPPVEEILTNVANEYRSAQKYLITGKGTIESPNLNGPKSTEFTLAVELPDKMRMEGDTSTFGMGGFSGPVLFVADGETTWVYDSSAKKYYKTRRSSPQGSVGKFENRYPVISHNLLPRHFRDLFRQVSQNRAWHSHLFTGASACRSGIGYLPM